MCFLYHLSFDTIALQRAAENFKEVIFQRQKQYDKLKEPLANNETIHAQTMLTVQPHLGPRDNGERVPMSHADVK